jgi:hypothetical protein
MGYIVFKSASAPCSNHYRFDALSPYPLSHTAEMEEGGYLRGFADADPDLFSQKILTLICPEMTKLILLDKRWSCVLFYAKC